MEGSDYVGMSFFELAFRLSTNDCVTVAFLGELRGLPNFSSSALSGSRPWKTSVGEHFRVWW